MSDASASGFNQASACVSHSILLPCYRRRVENLVSIRHQPVSHIPSGTFINLGRVEEKFQSGISLCLTFHRRRTGRSPCRQARQQLVRRHQPADNPVLAGSCQECSQDQRTIAHSRTVFRLHEGRQRGERQHVAVPSRTPQSEGEPALAGRFAQVAPKSAAPGRGPNGGRAGPSRGQSGGPMPAGKAQAARAARARARFAKLGNRARGSAAV